MIFVKGALCSFGDKIYGPNKQNKQTVFVFLSEKNEYRRGQSVV